MQIVKLLNLIKGFTNILGPIEFLGDHEIDDVVYDHRKVQIGSIFACVQGEHVDGHSFAPSAYEQGAKVFLCQRKISTLPEKDTIQIVVPDVRSFMGYVAAILYNSPSTKLTMVAITGTNGKTTSSIITHSILLQAGIKAGLLGTIYTYDGSEWCDSLRTTDEGPDLQRNLKKMVENGCSVCVMEASSHGIEQGRLNGCFFDVVVFSNLTPDHLDYHKGMDEYFNAKKLLFTKYVRRGWHGIVNIDDEYGAKLLSEFPENCTPYSVRIQSSNGFFGRVCTESIEGMHATISLPNDSKLNVRIPLIGDYNLQNTLQALAIASSLNVNVENIKRGIENTPAIPGRIERYPLSNGVWCVIDFAHTPDGLQKLLLSLRKNCRGRMAVIWGAGGDRSVEKRPLAGRVLGELADKVIISNDNPRSEEPMKIAEQIMQGVLKKDKIKCRIILERASAIEMALTEAEKGDIVVIAGKGPERYMQIGSQKVPFQDFEELEAWCRRNNVEVLS